MPEQTPQRGSAFWWYRQAVFVPWWHDTRRTLRKWLLLEILLTFASAGGVSAASWYLFDYEHAVEAGKAGLMGAAATTLIIVLVVGIWHALLSTGRTWAIDQHAIAELTSERNHLASEVARLYPLCSEQGTEIARLGSIVATQRERIAELGAELLGLNQDEPTTPSFLVFQEIRFTPKPTFGPASKIYFFDVRRPIGQLRLRAICSGWISTQISIRVACISIASPPGDIPITDIPVLRQRENSFVFELPEEVGKVIAAKVTIAIPAGQTRIKEIVEYPAGG